ncbi:MAG: hypothetical protein N6V49_06100, partial [Serratia symbiotica]|nr:hypothetical protein [Serratia symbiotica]
RISTYQCVCLITHQVLVYLFARLAVNTVFFLGIRHIVVYCCFGASAAGCMRLMLGDSLSQRDMSTFRCGKSKV